ncbi:PepSY domain-containing protein [Patulibacter americanus]|uniref:PepSY domain-containing protein n=1 Tax=Patulibacter americanus TaxID=588672 RepID=UPI0003B51C24|nr:PepSY domain-containing protein [Patulibacter americanus]
MTPTKERTMNRTRTALTATVLAAATAAGGVAVAAGPASAGSETAASRAATPTVAGDGGLTHAAATKARAAATKKVAGRATSIDRDTDDGRTTYDVTVLPRTGPARQVELDARFRVTRTERDDADGLTYAAAGRAEAAATKRVKGLVTGIDLEDEGRARFEVEVLPSRGAERTVRLAADMRVVEVVTDDDGDADDRDDD